MDSLNVVQKWIPSVLPDAFLQNNFNLSLIKSRINEQDESLRF